MSNEEALQILSERDRIRVNIINANDAETTKYNNDSVEALSMAIAALKAEPCEDCVSRQAVIELAKKGTLISNGNFKSVCEAINNLPRIYPTLPTMVYSQVPGVTPCVVPDYQGGWRLVE